MGVNGLVIDGEGSYYFIGAASTLVFCLSIFFCASSCTFWGNYWWCATV
eukprot:SAG11_NODE_3763_length_2243_cov_9.527052_3_plen_49_part_00